jgi:DNA-binding CsgD family transcriptional regulator
LSAKATKAWGCGCGFALSARGKTSAEIAQILGLTKRTVDFHTDNARGKLGAATRTEAAIKAASGKLIEP